MYLGRTLLPPVSNREDLLLTVSLFDDDTGQAIKLDGCTTANGQAFTSAAWTVVTSDANGNVINTTSATSITIPAFPISNQVIALALTVASGLAIAAAQPITIKDTATGLNKMVGYVTSYNANTGALVVQIGVTFQFEIRRGGPRNINIDDFTPFFYVGQVLTSAPQLAAALGTGIGQGITHIDTGVIQIRIAEAQFKILERRTYQAALTMTDSVDTREIFVASLPVGYGGVTI